MSDKTDILFQLGRPQEGAEWPDYLAYGLTRADVPRLIALCRDPALYDADPDSDEAWAPVHAWRALGQLRAAEAIEPLIGLFDRLHDDDWGLSELGKVVGMMGEPAIGPLASYLAQPGHEEFARIMAVDALAEAAGEHPELRDRMLAIYRDYLRHPDTGAPMLNGALMGRLLDLQAVELIDDIRRLFALGCVDVTYAGDLEEIEIRLGLRTARETPPPDYGRLHGLYAEPQDADEGDDVHAQIERLLDRYGSDASILDASELDGLLASLACAPQMIPPSRWMNEIWGSGALAPAWEDMEEAQAFVSALMLMHNRVNGELREGLYEPLFLERTADDRRDLIVDDWCEGFMRGLRLWPPLSAADRALLEECTAPIRLFATDEGVEALEGMGHDQIEDPQQRIAPAVEKLFEHFVGPAHPSAAPYVRETPKVGRNDPCPCGSGKKYKRCCLH